MRKMSSLVDYYRVILIDDSRTGEPPFIKSVLEKYHDTAKANGAIVSVSHSFIATSVP